MSDIVFVLGAGASKSAGAPLMLEFLDVADRLHRTAQVAPDTKTAFEDVAKARAALDAVHAKASIDADNLEEVFAAFDMARLFRQFGSMDTKLVERLPTSLRTVIAEVLDKTIRVSIAHGSERRLVTPGGYDDFAKLIYGLLNRNAETVSVITFNYDVALEFGLYRSGIGIDYCLGLAIPGRHDHTLDVMKLHGSVNWTQCKECGVATYGFEQYFKDWNWEFNAMNLMDRHEVCFDFRERIKRFKHCETKGSIAEPAIIPPTWNKGVHHYPEIESVWRRAAGHLAQARTIVVMGYSLPPTDHFFRYLYALGSLGATRLERFIVMNPDIEVKDRFRGLLGRGVERRFEFRKWPFVDAIAPLGIALLKERSLRD